MPDKEGGFTYHTHTATHESVCAALVGGRAAFVGTSEACIDKRDDSSEVTNLLYRNDYYIETIIPIRLNPP
jgi:hypothetical protein